MLTNCVALAACSSAPRTLMSGWCVQQKAVERVLGLPPARVRGRHLERARGAGCCPHARAAQAAALEYFLEEQGLVLPVERRARADHHPIDARALAVEVEGLEQQHLHHAAYAARGDAQARRLGEAPVPQPGGQRHRLLDGKRPLAVGLDAHRAERLAIELGFREQHGGVRVAVARLGRAQQLRERGHVARVGGVADVDGLVELGFGARDAHGERHALRGDEGNDIGLRGRI
jgi:hypothetical protein